MSEPTRCRESKMESLVNLLLQRLHQYKDQPVNHNLIVKIQFELGNLTVNEIKECLEKDFKK